MTAIRNKITHFFDWHKEVKAAPLAIYRVSFGALMLFSTIRFLANGWVDEFYVQPAFHFSYYGFGWIPYPGAVLLYTLFALMIMSSIMIMLGFLYRIGTIVFFLSFTYVELLDKTTYLNHYYFVSLIAFLLIFIPAHRYFSLDSRLGIARRSNTTAMWHIGILKFQIAIVYIFAGIAKLEPDWLLHAQPLKYWLHTAHHWNITGELLKQDWVAYLFSWFGCLYDLLIVFFLLNKSTRKIAYLFVIIFHLTTWLLFPIGVFPWVMMVATLIFFSPDFHEKLISKFQSLFKIKFRKTELRVKQHNYKLINTLLAAYICIQILVPFRYLLYPGDLFWTEQGFRFSWRVMLMEKGGYATFYLKDPVTKKEIEIDNGVHLTHLQEKMMSTQPDMILEYAHYLKDTYNDTILNRNGVEIAMSDPEVHAEVYVTLNARPHQLYIDKHYNLANIDYDLSNRYWIEPLKPCE